MNTVSDYSIRETIINSHNRSMSLPHGRMYRRMSAEGLSTDLSNFARRCSNVSNGFSGPNEIMKHFNPRLTEFDGQHSCFLHPVPQDQKLNEVSWPELVHASQSKPPESQAFCPGLNAPLPNPTLSQIRRSESRFKSTSKEFRNLCELSLPESSCLDLRLPTFDNWMWSEAQLLRFVRQMYFDLGLVQHLLLPVARLDNWLLEVFRRYNLVPFHNFMHAFMVTQMMYTMLWHDNLKDRFNHLEQAVLITASVCHDLDHPGYNNAYQINAGTQLAMRYNDQSPLENHHASVAFDILSRVETNPFRQLHKDQYKLLREGIIRCILATDMARHNSILSQFQKDIPRIKKNMDHLKKEDKDLISMILIKVADISNEARPLEVAGPWIDRLLDEFFTQTDFEKLNDLPVAPFMDREKVTKPASQVSFIQFVIIPLFESLVLLLPGHSSILTEPAKSQLEHYKSLIDSEAFLR